MAVIRNHTKEKLAAGEIAVGMGLRLSRTVEIAKIAKVSGFDWLFIDMEHSPMALDTVVQISAAALDAEITPLVRTPGHEHYHASRALDGGAQGVVVPHVSTLEEAERVASNCRYPPIGHRSVFGGLPQLEYASVPMAEATATLNDNTLVVAMLETPAAIANVEAIAAVDGIDALLIGTNDLCVEMGIPGQLAHEDVARAFDKTISACRNSGKHPGMGGIYDEELAPKYIRMGMRLVLAGNDFSFLMGAAKSRASFIRALSA